MFSRRSLIFLTILVVKCNRRLCFPILIHRGDLVTKVTKKSTRGRYKNKIVNENGNTLFNINNDTAPDVQVEHEREN